MKRPRKGARRPPAARHPRKRPPMEALLAERGIVRSTLAGIPKRDRADVEAEVLLNAWNAVRRGLYRPDPKDKPRDALRKWLHGIAWRLASHYFGSAYVRRVVPHPSPLGLLHERVGPDLEARIAAREVLDAMASLPPWQVDALLSVDDPESVSAYARRHRMSPHTALSRLRIARKALALRLKRWRR
ncbi:RNA polymerase sigma factor [Sorangium sp. So ce1024]|uniref:RNA polymerase sigma factor n=1 Tax=Sorangium sp. So ce1024 TaxID=3133327 RepID=UPI003F04EC6E